MTVGDMAVYTFGNGRQTINNAYQPIRIKVKSGIQDIKGMIPDTEYSCELVQIGTKNVCRFRTIRGHRDISLQKLYFIKQLKT